MRERGDDATHALRFGVHETVQVDDDVRLQRVHVAGDVGVANTRRTRRCTRISSSRMRRRLLDVAEVGMVL